jgi:hypothetical protein
MPLKLNVGLSKKVGQPEYGSLCASCHVECELDAAFLATELDRFHAHVRETFLACSQAVHDELARQQSTNATAATGYGPASARPDNAQNVQASPNGNDKRATAKQLEYAEKLASDIHALNVRRLESVAARMFSKPLAELSSVDASALIDKLKDIKAGKVDVAAAANGGRI